MLPNFIMQKIVYQDYIFPKKNKPLALANGLDFTFF
jgi:hypothetical protein